MPGKMFLVGVELPLPASPSQHELLQLSIYVPPYIKSTPDGHIIKVDGYWRKGTPAQEYATLRAAKAGKLNTPQGPVIVELDDTVYKSSKTGTVLIRHGDGSWSSFEAGKSNVYTIPAGTGKAKGLLIAVHKADYEKIKAKGEAYFGDVTETPAPSTGTGHHITEISEKLNAAIAKVQADTPQAKPFGGPGNVSPIPSAEPPSPLPKPAFKLNGDKIAEKHGHANAIDMLKANLGPEHQVLVDSVEKYGAAIATKNHGRNALAKHIGVSIGEMQDLVNALGWYLKKSGKPAVGGTEGGKSLPSPAQAAALAPLKVKQVLEGVTVPDILDTPAHAQLAQKDDLAFLSQFRQKYTGYSYDNSPGNINKYASDDWQVISPEERLKRFSEPSVAQDLEARIERIKVVAKWPESKIAKSDKQKIGKHRARFETLLRASRLGHAVLEETANPAAALEELDYLTTRMGPKKATTVFGRQTPIYINHIFDPLYTSTKKFSYKKNLEDLGILDPEAAPLAKVRALAKDNAAPHSEQMTEEEVRYWLRWKLGDPSTSKTVAMQHERAVKTRVVTANLLSQVQKKLAEKPGPEPTNVDTPAAATALKIHLAKQAKLLSLKDSYVWNASDASLPDDESVPVAVKRDADGQQWNLIYEGGGFQIASLDDALQALVDHPELQPSHESKDVETPAHIDAKTAPFGTDDSAVINDWIKQRDGNYLGKMSVEDRREWMRAYLRGDNVLLWQIESAAAGKGIKPVKHKDSKKHQGSPDSAKGKLSRQAMSDWIASQDWGGEFFAGKPVDEWNPAYRSEAYESLNLGAELGTDMKPSPGLVAVRLQKWRALLAPSDLPEPTIAVAISGAQPVFDDIQKPSDVSSNTWDMLVGMEKLGDVPTLFADISPYLQGLSEDEARPKAQTGDTYSMTPTQRAAIVKGTPANVLKLWLWARGHTPEDSAPYPPDDLEQAIKYRAAEGAYDFFAPGAFGTVLMPDGSTYVIQKGDDLHGNDPNNLIAVINGSNVKVFSKSGTVLSMAQAKALPKPTVLKSAPVSPKPVTLAMALADGHAWSPTTWNLVTSTASQPNALNVFPDNSPESTWSEKQINNFLIGKMSPQFLANAPVAAKQFAVYSFLYGAPPTGTAPQIEILDYLAKQGHWGFNVGRPYVDPLTEHGKLIAFGLTEPSDIGTYWNHTTIQAFLQSQNVDNLHYYDYQGVSDAIKNLTDEPLLPVADPNEPEKLSFTYVGKAHEGSHGQEIWVDQLGRKYRIKRYESTGGRFRVDQEVAGAKIARLMGFNHPPVYLEELGGKGKHAYVQLNAAAPGGTLVGVNPVELDDEELFQVAEEHVVDWLLSNHDSHPANFLRLGKGQIAGVDKGQSWKWFPEDKLLPGYKGSNPLATVYDQVYAGIVSHKIDKERADKLVKHLLLRARRMETRFDDQVRDLLAQAFESRPGPGVAGGFPKQFPNADSMIEGVLERKHKLASDFEQLYKDIYEQAGYEWDLPPLDELAAKKVTSPDERDLYVGLSDDLMQDVKVSKVHGTSTFFTGEELEDSHLLLYTVTMKDGSQTLLADGKMRNEADKKLTAWIQQQTVTNAAGTSQVLTSADPASTLPGADDLFQKIAAAAKTTNYHVGQGDAPNPETMGQLTTAYANVQSQLSALHVFIGANPGKVHSAKQAKAYPLAPAFVDLEQQEAWLQMAELYSGYAQEVLDAAKKGEKTYTSHPDKKQYDPFAYAPKKKPKILNEWQSGDEKLTLKELDNGKWELVEDDEPTEINETDAKQLLADKAKAFQSAAALKATAGKAKKAIKFFKRKNSRFEGTFNDGTSELDVTGETQAGVSGQKFEIEVGDAAIEYWPWNGNGISLSQQGTIRLKVKNWKGDQTQLEDLFDVLKQAGFDLTPADEQYFDLLYWRMMASVAGDRIGYDSGGQGDLVQKFSAWKKQHPNPSPEEELAYLKKLWAGFLGDDLVDGADTFPRFMHQNLDAPEQPTGKPFWIRPYTPAQEQKLRAIGHSITGAYSTGKGDRAFSIVTSGGLYPTDERTRVLGQWITGMSSNADQNVGSASFIFFHPSASGDIFAEPEIWLRTHNYIYSGDHFGKLQDRKAYAPFGIDDMLKKTSGEIMLKNGVSLLDDIVAIRVDAATRTKILNYLHAKGITQIRGVQIEDRFLTAVTESQIKDLIAKSRQWAEMQKTKKELVSA